MLKGIDVSHWQGLVGWKGLKASYGLSFGACKATEGLNTQDNQFANNWQGMLNNDLIRMAYHFGRPDNDPVKQAKYFLSYVGKTTPTDIMVMDMESNPNNLPMLAVNDWLCSWADYVTSETGRKPFIYCGSGYMTNNATKDVKKHYAAWWYPQYPSAYDGKTVWPNGLGNYPTNNNWGSAPDIWQFSQSFAGKYDANISTMSINDLKTRGTITLGVDMLDPTDKTYIDQRLQAYFLWMDMRDARRDLLAAQARKDASVSVLQTEYDNAYTAWKKDTGQ